MRINSAEINQLNSLIDRQLSFALYRLPGQSQPILRLQTKGDVCQVKNINQLNEKSGFVVVPFSQSKDCPIVLLKPDVSAFGWEEIFTVLNNITVNLTEKKAQQKDGETSKSLSKEEYFQLFEKFIEPLHQNQFQKLVLSRSYTIQQKADFSVLQAFVQACETYPFSFVYLCHTPYTGTWLGSTSETILSGDSKAFHTVAMAGTMLAVEEKMQVWSDKNKQEQALVAEYIRHQLESLQIQLTEEESETIQAGQLLHLKSDFYFSLPDNNQLGSLLNLLHPTPAVCGLPKKEAYQFILNNEGYSRKYYAGFLGWLEPSSRTDLFVNLRCMNIHSGGLTLYAGGGILPSSEPEAEWEETQAKMKTMLALLSVD